MSRLGANLQNQDGRLRFVERETIDHSPQHRDRTDFKTLRVDSALKQRGLHRNRILSRQTAKYYILLSDFRRIEFRAVIRIQKGKSVFVVFDAKLLRANL